MIEYLSGICETLCASPAQEGGNPPSHIVLPEVDEGQTLNLMMFQTSRNKTKKEHMKGVHVWTSTVGECFYFETLEVETITKKELTNS